MSPNSSLYVGRLYHRREQPARNEFTYRVFSFFLDLDEIENLARRLKLFSHNRFSPFFSFFDRDHFRFEKQAADGRTLKQRVVDFIAKERPELGVDRVLLLTNVRMAGYTFNPVSFYHCYDRTGKLLTVLAEVNNTYLEQKPFLVEPGVNAAKKLFYVSPFIEHDTHFEFEMYEPGESLTVRIDSLRGRETVLHAALYAKQLPLTDGNLFKLYFRQPLFTFKVIIAIHYQALRLWLKRIPYFEKGKTDRILTILNNQGEKP